MLTSYRFLRGQHGRNPGNVDAVGGIVESPLAFNQNDFNFVEGTNQLDGEAALAFSRMRYEDPAGDTGRQGRQRLVIEGVIRKLAAPEILLNTDHFAVPTSNVQTSFNRPISTRPKSRLPGGDNMDQQQLGAQAV
jgi:anionic cell wall polymer biosynthesis LytR-Cps2A-Psr (LCP) family protein